MRKIIVLVFIFFILGCEKKNTSAILKIINTDDYELIISKKQNGLLILFPSLGGSPENIKKEFKIVRKATEKGISLLFINVANKLWITPKSCEKLSIQVKNITEKYSLRKVPISIGGMSAGGNLALTFSAYLLKKKLFAIKGVFIVDSPIDLFRLYEGAVKEVTQFYFSEERLAESKWIIRFLEEKFTKKRLYNNIQKINIFNTKEASFDAIADLKNTKLRLYTEPALNWRKNVRKSNFEYSNTYSIRKMNNILQRDNWKKVTLIETKNKGYRANGNRNPHSWSIVHVDNLLAWILA